MANTAIEATAHVVRIIPRVISGRMATALLLIEGFVSVSIQMIVLRQLVPVVGYSINVTSIVITTFLGALALGYRQGGRHRVDIGDKIQRNLILVAMLSGLGLSYWLVEYVFSLYFARFDSALIAVALYSVFFLGPIVYFLAQTVVLLINFRQGAAAAEQAGETFHISTIGNVVGGLATTLIVMYYLGIAAAVVLNVSLLVLAYLLIANRLSLRSVVLSIAALLVALVFNVIVEREIFLVTTAHGNYSIADTREESGRYLFANGQNASRTDNLGIGHPYIEWFEDHLFAGQSVPTDILVLGAGGFSLGQGRIVKSTLTYVDVDERLAMIAESFLSPNSRLGGFAPEDARAFLIRTLNQYDAIVLDTYSQRSSVPAHLVTKEFFSLLRDRLTVGGVVYMNFIFSDDDSYTFSRGIDNTIRSVFAKCSTHRINTTSIAMFNLLYRCERNGLDSYGVVYTDGNTKAAFDISN